jgi:hypothetical protein
VFYLVIEEVEGASDPEHVRVRQAHNKEDLVESMRAIAANIAWYRRAAIYKEVMPSESTYVDKYGRHLRRVDSVAGGQSQ